jgi:hypothetical protein
MLGLFAGQDFEVGEMITSYGGVFRDSYSVAREPKELYTHIHRIRDSPYLLDGRLSSMSFARSPIFMRAQAEIPINSSMRAHFSPSFDALSLCEALSTVPQVYDIARSAKRLSTDKGEPDRTPLEKEYLASENFNAHESPMERLCIGRTERGAVVFWYMVQEYGLPLLQALALQVNSHISRDGIGIPRISFNN